MMTKDQFQKELQEKIKAGIKPSHLKKLKRSKSADDIPTSTTSPLPLQKSKSQLELPLANQPSQEQQIADLQAAVKFHAQTAQNYLSSLQTAQAKITELEEELQSQEIFTEAPEENPTELKEKITKLEDQILQLRFDKIKDFGDYLEKKQDLETELELNITEGVSEIQRLENKLLATNKKKLELQQKLGTSQSKIAQLELKLIENKENSPSSWNFWPWTVLALSCLTLWLLNKPTHHYE